jgi:succinate dehydrogenase / fumarate reductase cytochrome b subunit
MSTLKATLSGSVRYRGREGQLSFILHRLTGLGTLLFLTIHILDTATVYFAPNLYDHAIAIYQSTPFMIGEIFLVFSVLFHGANGLRIALFDLFPNLWVDSTQRKAFIMGRNLVINNFLGG